MLLKLIKVSSVIAVTLCNLSFAPNISVQDNTVVSKEVKTQYVAKISIPKINISQNLYGFDSKMNHVDKGIEILKSSDMPDVINGNFILAAHSGYSSISYFHHLYKLQLGDIVTINYNSKRYEYIVSEIYDVFKTGKVKIKRDKSKRTITMITCKGEDKQLVVIGYLKGE